MKTLVMPTPQDDVRRSASWVRSQATGRAASGSELDVAGQAEKWEHLAQGAVSGMASGHLAAVPAQKVA